MQKEEEEEKEERAQSWVMVEWMFMGGVGRGIEYVQSISCEILKELIKIILKFCQLGKNPRSKRRNENRILGEVILS